MNRNCVLSLACDDRPGLVAAIASFLAGHGGNITDAEQYNDASTARFFMRVAFDPGPTAPETYRDLFAPLAKEHGMDWRLRVPGYRPRIVVMVSRFDHCLADLLNRQRSGELAMDIAAKHSSEQLNSRWNHTCVKLRPLRRLKRAATASDATMANG